MLCILLFLLIFVSFFLLRGKSTTIEFVRGFYTAASSFTAAAGCIAILKLGGG